MSDLTTAEQDAPKSRRRAKPPDPQVAQSAAVAGASATVVQAPQAVKTDIAVLKHEREPG